MREIHWHPHDEWQYYIFGELGIEKRWQRRSLVEVLGVLVGRKTRAIGGEGEDRFYQTSSYIVGGCSGPLMCVWSCSCIC